jgi:hypothetical protein
MKMLLMSAVLVLVEVCAAYPAVTGASASQSNPRVRGTQTADVSYFMPQVRLRKLHLVRPDLIPYPIDVEVVC